MTTSPEAPNTSKTPMARRLLKKVPPQIRIIFGVLGLLLIFGLFSLGMQLFMLLVVVMSEVPWVASGILLGIFLILLLPSKGWTVFGTLLFIVGAIVSAIADVPGNPIYNAPFEALFLNRANTSPLASSSSTPPKAKQPSPATTSSWMQRATSSATSTTSSRSSTAWFCIPSSTAYSSRCAASSRK